MKVLGLVYGKGTLPLTVALEAKAKGYKVAAIALDPIADDSLKPHADFFKRVSAGHLGEVIKTLKKHGASEAVVAGKISKKLLYGKILIPDIRGAKLLFTLKDRADDTIILAVAGEFEKDGIKMLGIADFCSNLITPEGVLTKTRPDEKGWKDIKFGFGIAKEIGRLDIGQTVVVKDRAVMAVEAIEGTDEAIRRGGRLAGEGATVVKVIRPSQDPRFDVPVVGLDTLSVIIEAKIRALALEAGRSIFLEKEEFLRRAEEAGVSIVGVTESSLK